MEAGGDFAYNLTISSPAEGPTATFSTAYKDLINQ
jgi:hypothetical protein